MRVGFTRAYDRDAGDPPDRVHRRLRGLGGTLAAKGIVPQSLGTFRTDNGMLVGLVIGVIFIIGLTFFHAVSLGPVVEQLSRGKFL